jgi:hypothetical protein
MSGLPPGPFSTKGGTIFDATGHAVAVVMNLGDDELERLLSESHRLFELAEKLLTAPDLDAVIDEFRESVERVRGVPSR